MDVEPLGLFIPRQVDIAVGHIHVGHEFVNPRRRDASRWGLQLKVVDPAARGNKEDVTARAKAPALPLGTTDHLGHRPQAERLGVRGTAHLPNAALTEKQQQVAVVREQGRDRVGDQPQRAVPANHCPVGVVLNVAVPRRLQVTLVGLDILLEGVVILVVV